jgi:hypothetical protein
MLLGTLALKQAASAFPWYDDGWLRQYVAALKFIDQVRPSLRADFVAAFDRLRTPLDFRVRKLDRVFDDAVMAAIRRTIAELAAGSLEKHEVEGFGRSVVHDHSLFNQLHQAIVPLASELAGEALEPSYNFLSLYSDVGVCQPHLDMPVSKWTLDLCIDQSDVWPIHFSQVVPWPEAATFSTQDWQERIKASPDLKFSSWSLRPGEALWFSGSSQWHYRDRMEGASDKSYCNLLFFHFLPHGMSSFAEPRNWPDLFGLPELRAVVDPVKFQGN